LTATTYPTLTAFLDEIAKPDTDRGRLSVAQANTEAFLLGLLVRWQLEDEGAPLDLPALAETNKDLAEINLEMTDDERGAVLRQIIVWITNGDGWLRDYINRTAELR